MPYFHHEGIQLHYVDVDNREDPSRGLALLFVHGAGSSLISWALQLREFSSTNRTVAIDLSGHGKSDDRGGEVSIESVYALELAALIDHLGLSDLILVGHSMGGGVVMSYCLNDKLVSPMALVLVDTSTVLELSRLARGLVKEAVEDRIFLFKNQFYEDYTETYRLKELQARTRRENPSVIQKDLVACNKFNIKGRLNNIMVPTFILVGENDDITPPIIAEELKKELPHADIAVIRNADHEPMVEQPEEFNRLLRKFVTWVEERD